MSNEQTVQPIPKGIHRGDIGRQRARIAPLLTGEDLAELLALADFCIASGGSFHHGKPSSLSVRLARLRLIELAPNPHRPRAPKLHRLTKLGWFTLLTRAGQEMRHLLPPADAEIEGRVEP
jgi:hypothetical protein